MKEFMIVICLGWLAVAVSHSLPTAAKYEWEMIEREREMQAEVDRICGVKP